MIRVDCLCHECGITFPVHPYRADTARYCSRGCKSRNLGRIRRGKPCPRKLSLPDRFWAKVLKETTEACWLWQGPKDKDGYGHFAITHRRQMPAHRVAYILVHGPIPDDIKVCHDCPDGDNPACVNPAHLWLGTQGQNVQDSILKGRRRLPSNTKLTDADLPEICRLYKPYRYGQVQLARHFGVSQCTMQRFLQKHHLTPGRGPRLPA
jgi:hypothetical protein